MTINEAIETLKANHKSDGIDPSSVDCEHEHKNQYAVSYEARRYIPVDIPGCTIRVKGIYGHGTHGIWISLTITINPEQSA